MDLNKKQTQKRISREVFVEHAMKWNIFIVYRAFGFLNPYDCDKGFLSRPNCHGCQMWGGSANKCNFEDSAELFNLIKVVESRWWGVLIRLVICLFLIFNAISFNDACGSCRGVFIRNSTKLLDNNFMQFYHRIMTVRGRNKQRRVELMT